LANRIKKEDPTICCLQKTHLHDRNKHWLRVKGWKKIYQALGPRKQAGVAILILDKVDFKLTLIKRDKEGHSILIKGGNTPKGNNNYQPICTQHQCIQFHQTHSEGPKNIYRL
jgi:exonuclease III